VSARPLHGHQVPGTGQKGDESECRVDENEHGSVRCDQNTVAGLGGRFPERIPTSPAGGCAGGASFNARRTPTERSLFQFGRFAIKRKDSSCWITGRAFSATPGAQWTAWRGYDVSFCNNGINRGRRSVVEVTARKRSSPSPPPARYTARKAGGAAAPLRDCRAPWTARHRPLERPRRLFSPTVDRGASIGGHRSAGIRSPGNILPCIPSRLSLSPEAGSKWQRTGRRHAGPEPVLQVL
jgi:hypothetical protein